MASVVSLSPEFPISSEVELRTTSGVVELSRSTLRLLRTGRPESEAGFSDCRRTLYGRGVAVLASSSSLEVSSLDPSSSSSSLPSPALDASVPLAYFSRYSTLATAIKGSVPVRSLLDTGAIECGRLPRSSNRASSSSTTTATPLATPGPKACSSS